MTERAINESLGFALAEMMGNLSESCWCAGWMDGTEEAIWALVEGRQDRDRWGMCRFAPGDERIAALRELAEAAGCWVVWDDSQPSWRKLVPLAEWREIAERHARQTGRRGEVVGG